MKAKLICKYCKKEFEVNYKDRNKRTYCSLACRVAWRKEFYTHSEETKKKIAQAHLGKIKSQEEREKISKTRKERIAQGLIKSWNKGLTIDDPRVKKGIEKTKETFKNIGHSKKEKNPNWKGGKEFWKKFEYNRNWQTLRKWFLQFNPLCELCNEKAVLVHHKDFSTKNDSPENLQTLCRRCHKQIHSAK